MMPCNSGNSPTMALVRSALTSHAARSAVFAPAPNLGLIVVDEEHEPSFKQESTPRYHGRDVAVMRANLLGIPVVLGSATPSLESWFNASRGIYTRLDLTRRVEDRPLPKVEVLDMRHPPARVPPGRALSDPLVLALKHTLRTGGQAILFLNRRGYSPFVVCPACGEELHHHRADDAGGAVGSVMS